MNNLWRITHRTVASGPSDTDVVVLVSQVELQPQVCFCIGGGTCIPVKTCDCSCLGGVVLETVLLWSHEVATLVLSDSDVPGPGGGGGGGVDVQRDGHTGVTGGNP